MTGAARLVLPMASLACLVAVSPHQAAMTGLPDCGNTLSWTVADSPGADPQHERVLVAGYNFGERSCEIPGLPALRFADADGAPMDVVRRIPPGLHPGPMILPRQVAAGGTAAVQVTWAVAAGGARCMTPATVAVAGGDVVAFGRSMCGVAGQAVQYDQPPLWLLPGP